MSTGAEREIPEPDGLSDEALMMQFSRQGRQDAFETLYRRYRRQIFGFFINGTGCRELAEELYQELFMKIIQHAGNYRPTAAFRTWIFAIARNQLRDAYRRGSVRQIMQSLDSSTAETANSPVEPPADKASNPHRRIQDAEIRKIVLQTLRELPRHQREMFLLRESNGLDFKDAARMAFCSVNTAKSRMRYALMRLREAFTEHGIRPER
ncbi:sigma-70 family RNA polymerase sigma factor [bacterium]|nr:sigma-70 family RNA polymerase sigma factor [candidate division CSSED10-310 bacterium]